jgi:hypothetical protein
MEPKYHEERKQTYTVSFQNAPSHEQVLFMYRNALNDFIHQNVLEQKK